MMNWISVSLHPACHSSSFKNVSWVSKSVVGLRSLSFRQNQLMNFELIFPRKQIFYLFLLYFIVCGKQIHKGFIGVTANFWGEENPPRNVWWAWWPPYISHSLHRQPARKSIILLSSAVQMETTLSIMHHLHSTTCNAERLLSPPRSPHLRSFKGCRGCIQTAGYTLS